MRQSQQRVGGNQLGNAVINTSDGCAESSGIIHPIDKLNSIYFVA
jgi:hypothetical protein